jgi:hypothetical protein
MWDLRPLDLLTVLVVALIGAIGRLGAKSVDERHRPEAPERAPLSIPRMNPGSS